MTNPVCIGSLGGDLFGVAVVLVPYPDKSSLESLRRMRGADLRCLVNGCGQVRMISGPTTRRPLASALGCARRPSRAVDRRSNEIKKGREKFHSESTSYEGGVVQSLALGLGLSSALGFR